ncbi:MAG: hypothetical protein AAFZ80_06890 [Cyanobacteria bacterium P01_A01_bin.105]
MNRFSFYWRLVKLSSSGHCDYQVFPRVRDWLRQQGYEHLSDRALQLALFDGWRTGGSQADLAQLSLRCFVSHQIRQACYSLGRQFGQRYGFTPQDLLPFVLTDTVRPRPVRRAFALEILTSYRPDKQAQLSSWAIRLTKNHGALNDFLLEQGLYRVSDWAILNDTSRPQLTRILTDYHGESLSQVEMADELLHRYHQVYKRDRRQAQCGTRRCEQPTAKQLQQIDAQYPPEQVLAQLQTLADQLRQYRIYVRSGNPQAFKVMVSFEDLQHFTLEDWADVQNTNLIEGPDDPVVFFERYQHDLEQCLRQAIDAGLRQRLSQLRQRDALRAQAYLAAVHLFHGEGLSMGAIAQQLTQQFSPRLRFNNQVQITRLLQLRELRHQVRDLTLAQIRECVYQQSQHYLSDEQIAQLRPVIDAILAQAVDQIMAEAAAEAQTPNRQLSRSWFARQLCAVVPTLCA